MDNMKNSITEGINEYEEQYDIPDIPEWNDTMRKMIPGDDLTSAMFNGLFSKILENEHYLKILVTSGDASERSVVFTPDASRANIANGEKLSVIFGKIAKYFADLKTVAFSGSYDDLENKPTIPAVNNGILTIQKNGTKVQTFSANQSSNVTVNITVPTKVSELANDSGFLTSQDINGKLDKTGGTITGDLTVKTLKISSVSSGVGMQFSLTNKPSEGIILYDNSVAPLADNYTDLGGDGHYWKTVYAKNLTGDGSDVTAVFTRAGTRANISTGEKLSVIFGKIAKFFADLKTVAFSGSYDDLTDKPAIPAVNNGILTIQKNGTKVQTFSANQSSNVTVNITVPTKVSELANDIGLLTSHQDISGKLDKTGGTITGDLTVKTLKISSVSSGTGMQFSLTNKTSEGIILYDNSFAPLTDNYTGLGGDGHRWKQLVSVTSTISTSDRNLKDNISPLDDRYLELFKRLQPVSFMFKDGESGRTHIGFISQDVEKAMSDVGLTSLDFAGFCKDIKTREVKKVLGVDGDGNEIIEMVKVPDLDDDGNEQYTYSLRYEEFIAINTAVIQKQEERMFDAEMKIEKQAGEIRKLKSQIEEIMKMIV